MVVHETVGMAEPVVAFTDVGEDLEECLSVMVVFEYGLFVVTSVGDVIHCAGVFNAEGTCYKREFNRSLKKRPRVWT